MFVRATQYHASGFSSDLAYRRAMATKCHDAKVTTMVLKVDLECHKCYKKVKKVLCEFPQIRNQVYDEKANTVTITVVCCSPDKIADKLCCKGGGCIKSIEIKEPTPPKPPATDKPGKQGDDKPKPAPKPNGTGDEPKPPGKLEHRHGGPCCGSCSEGRCGGPCCGSCSEGRCGGPCNSGCGVPEPPCLGLPPTQPPPCCGPCSGGCYGGPCYGGCGVPEPKCPILPPKQPPPCCGRCSEGRCGGPCYGRLVCDSWAGGAASFSVCHVTRCDYFSEENPQACSIM